MPEGRAGLPRATVRSAIPSRDRSRNVIHPPPNHLHLIRAALPGRKGEWGTQAQVLGGHLTWSNVMWRREIWHVGQHRHECGRRYPAGSSTGPVGQGRHAVDVDA